MQHVLVPHKADVLVLDHVRKAVNLSFRRSAVHSHQELVLPLLDESMVLQHPDLPRHEEEEPLQARAPRDLHLAEEEVEVLGGVHLRNLGIEDVKDLGLGGCPNTGVVDLQLLLALRGRRALNLHLTEERGLQLRCSHDSVEDRVTESTDLQAMLLLVRQGVGELSLHLLPLGPRVKVIAPVLVVVIVLQLHLELWVVHLWAEVPMRYDLVAERTGAQLLHHALESERLMVHNLRLHLRVVRIILLQRLLLQQ
mmetsp:Transcript_46997/g.108626  ORF Transcript_46997/g.108626 Transcript_46997/m.108626 type:complete len:253 (+) Transcript_46997:1840-2598(+)